MLNIIKTVTAAVVFVGLTAGPTMAGETVSYKGSGTYSAQKLPMTLGNGDIVFTGWNEGVATISHRQARSADVDQRQQYPQRPARR